MKEHSLLYDTLKKVSWHSMIYGLGTSFTAFVGIILMPLYTRFLSPEEYGVYSLISILFTLLVFVYDLGMINALFRWIYHYEESEKGSRKRVASTVLIFLIFMAFISTSLLWNNTSHISRLIFKSDGFIYLIRLMLIGLCLQMLTWVPMSLLRIKERPMTFVSITAFGMVVMVAANFFLLLKGRGLSGIYEAYIISCLFMVIALFYVTRNEYVLAFSLKELKGMLKFGIPFLPVLFFSWVIDSSGRYFLGHFRTLEEVGLYSVGYKIGQIVYLAEKTFAVAWTPIMLSLAQRYATKAPEVLGRVFTYFVFLSAVLFVGTSVYGREAIRIFTASPYHDAFPIAPLIAMAYILYGIYIYMLSGLIITKNVYTQPFILFLAAAANIALNIVLVPRFGMISSACATIVSYLIAAVATYYFAQRSYPILVEFKRIGKVFLAAIVISIIGISFTLSNLAVSVLLKTASFLIFFGLLYLVGFFRPAEIRKVADVFRRGSAPA
ncbi:MAG: oligosaccharide flippase family protein [Candidatus Omnitrophota bacterium]|nr:oligosaccharide flippase family protein [Candidatus Omnitrophota bacterium]